MIECSGNILFYTTEAVTGRIWYVGNKKSDLRDSTKILVLDERHDISDNVPENTVGVILLHGASEEYVRRVSRLAEFCRLPALRLSGDTDFLLADSDDKIAILDTEHKKLYINPDLETINCFFGLRARKKGKSISLLADVSKPLHVLADGFDGIFIDEKATPDASEDEAYEFFCDVADKNTGYSIIATADFSSSEEQFVQHVRAIYRAGVWGRFSLLCYGLIRPLDADRCISLIHQAFCQLDSEGREFNGFIPKGLAISTPLMLLAKPKHRLIDFFCVDFSNLRRDLTGRDDKGIGQDETAEYVKSFVKEAGNAKISLRCGEKISETAFRALTHDGMVSEIYVPFSEVDRIRRWL